MVSSAYMAYMLSSNSKFNVIISGWLGIILSSLVLCSSFLTLQMQAEFKNLLQEFLFKGLTNKEQQFLASLLGIFGISSYWLSLLNTGFSLLLLIGVTRDISALMYPWLAFHGLLLGFSLYLCMIFATAGLFVDLSSFLYLFVILALLLVIFFKMYHEVLSLAYGMGQQERFVGYADVQRAWAVYVPRAALDH